jgi:hypothetical protein
MGALPALLESRPLRVFLGMDPPWPASCGRGGGLWGDNAAGAALDEEVGVSRRAFWGSGSCMGDKKCCVGFQSTTALRDVEDNTVIIEISIYTYSKTIHTSRPSRVTASRHGMVTRHPPPEKSADNACISFIYYAFIGLFTAFIDITTFNLCPVRRTAPYTQQSYSECN